MAQTALGRSRLRLISAKWIALRGDTRTASVRCHPAKRGLAPSFKVPVPILLEAFKVSSKQMLVQNRIIASTPRRQFVVCSCFRNSSLFQNQDAIAGVEHGG